MYLVIPRDSQKPSHLSLAPKTTPTIILCIGFYLSPHASMTPLFLRTFPVETFAPFSLSSGEAANRPMRLKWFPLLRRRRAHPPPILAPEQKPGELSHKIEKGLREVDPWVKFARFSRFKSSVCCLFWLLLQSG